MPITGPSEGSRSATMAFCPSFANASVKPMSVVDLPSPAGVGDTPVTTTSLPGLPDGTWVMSTLAMCLPYGMSASSLTPACAAMSAMGASSWAWAISTSVNG